MTSVRFRQIAASLRDKEYRDLVVAEEIDTGLPFQIRALRQAYGWSQKELATRLGITQEGVSRLESLSYGKYTLSTLKRLASAFDVALAVKFVPFSQLAAWMANMSPEDLAVPDYAHDTGLTISRTPPLSWRTESSSRFMPVVHADLSESEGYVFSGASGTPSASPPITASTAQATGTYVTDATRTEWSA